MTTVTDNELDAVARLLHADDLKRGRAFDSFETMNAESVAWYLDNAGAILAAGFRRPAPITDAQVEAALAAYDKVDYGRWLDGDAMRAALEAARDAS